MTKHLPMVLALALFTGCTKGPTVRSGVDLEQLIKDKNRVPPDSHEAITNTYFELTAWAQDSSKTPVTATSVPGTLGSTGQVACASATEKNGTDNTGRCEITIAGTKYRLKAGNTVALNGGGEVTLACAGDAPTYCKALGVN